MLEKKSVTAQGHQIKIWPLQYSNQLFGYQPRSLTTKSIFEYLVILIHPSVHIKVLKSQEVMVYREFVTDKKRC